MASTETRPGQGRGESRSDRFQRHGLRGGPSHNRSRGRNRGSPASGREIRVHDGQDEQGNLAGNQDSVEDSMSRLQSGVSSAAAWNASNAKDRQSRPGNEFLTTSFAGSNGSSTVARNLESNEVAGETLRVDISGSQGSQLNTRHSTDNRANLSRHRNRHGKRGSGTLTSSSSDPSSSQSQSHVDSSQVSERRKKVPRVPQNDPDVRSSNLHSDIMDVEGERGTSVGSEVRSGSDDFMTNVRFSTLDLCNELQLSLRNELKYDTMTAVQVAAIPVIRAGVDVLARARTGTGKTLAFLIPSIEKMIKNRNLEEIVAFGTLSQSKGAVKVLVLCPTRELALQIKKECLALVKYAKIPVLCFIGGTNFNSDANALSQLREPGILIATPGRLIDHLGNRPNLLGFLNVWILDEADQMLEMGFRPSIEKILASIPSQQQRPRQTLLFSATMPEGMRNVVSLVCRNDFVTVDTIGEDQIQTHEQVVQSHLVVNRSNSVLHVVRLIHREQRERPNDYKVLVFLVTARQTQFMSELLKELDIAALEMHSRKTQAFRAKMSEQFRNGNKLIMCSSDVSARGLDYPGVTCVIQLGVPTDREQYIHRLGRTARAGHGGKGILVLTDYERYFLQLLTDLPLMEEPLESISEDLRKGVQQAVSRVSVQTKSQTYAAWIGYYNGLLSKLKWSKEALVTEANQYARDPSGLGLTRLPVLQRKTVGKMGLRGVPGLIVE